MAGSSTSLSSSSQIHFPGSPQSQPKLCLFCLNPADYNPEKSSEEEFMKAYFRQFLWKYLIGDDMVKINEFTANHLRNYVPPMCSGCHDKCVQLANYHLEFEKIQNEIMQVSGDLLRGWKQKDSLLTKDEYDMAVRMASREKEGGRSKPPANRFIKSPVNQQAYPKYEAIQMYQILRNPGHVRIPLSCLKSFGFTELKNLTAKNSPIARHFFGGASKFQPSPPCSTSIIEKAKAASALVAAAKASIPMPKMIPISNASGPTKYWINDVQIEMLGPNGVSSTNSSDEDVYDEEEEDLDYDKQEPDSSSSPNDRLRMQHLPIPMLNKGNKRQKLEEPQDMEQEQEEDGDEYYDNGDDDGDGLDGECINYVQTVTNDSQSYEEDDLLDDEEQAYYDENGQLVYDDDQEVYDEEDYGDGSSHQYYNGNRHGLQLEIVDQNNQKKRKRVFVLRKGNWTAEEDANISRIVMEEGPKNWSKVALQLGTGRTGKQIRERWTHHLNPDVNKEPWSTEEDIVLMQAHAKLGNQWSRISKLLPGRTDNAVKNHWNGTLKRKAQLMQFGNNGH